MTHNIIIGLDYLNFQEASLNTNNNGELSAVFEIAGASRISWATAPVSGTHDNHVVTLRCSPNNIDWHNHESSILGIGDTDNVQTGCPFIQFIVTTPEGGVSSATKIIIAAKK